MHFLETFSQYIFHGSVLPVHARAMWGHLQKGITYYFRATSTESGRFLFSRQNSMDAHMAMYHYACLAGQVSATAVACVSGLLHGGHCHAYAWLL